MLPDLEAVGGQEPPSLFVPEIRDYQKINAELIALLDRGHPWIRLVGAEGQRLLASGLSGHWSATIEIIGRTGPELAAGMNAPGLTIVARGSTADGAGRGLIDGRIFVSGSATDGAGYDQSGGLLVIAGATGNRAGLRQSAGTIALLGPIGRLAGDRQSGGILFGRTGRLGPYPSRGQVGGRLILVDSPERLADADAREWSRVIDFASTWSSNLATSEPEST